MRVVIESPYGNVPDGRGGERRATPEELERNVRYARAALADSLRRGEAPYASHLLYPQCLDDATPAERLQGLEAGHAWRQKADVVAVYVDLGITSGMRSGIDRSHAMGVRVDVRTLPGWQP